MARYGTPIVAPGKRSAGGSPAGPPPARRRFSEVHFPPHTRIALSPREMPRQLIPHNDYLRTRIRSRGYLPHWEVEGATYSMTYRLHDSLPLHVLERLREEREALTRQLTGGLREPTAIERFDIEEAFALRLDDELHVERGECHLRYPQLADRLVENLQHFNGNRYDLFAWCVMPNHVHLVFRPFAGETLDRILHSWKSYTSHVASGIVGTTTLWAREYYDRMIRDERHFCSSVAYVRNNPAKAGLMGWKWVG
jgi:REP element-mobilizing transposase RayT